jgi:ribosome maturation factor RimP
VLGVCKHSGVDLIEIEKDFIGRRKVLRIFINKSGGVDVEDCASTSRYLSEELDKETNSNLIEGAYTLEVSSPGLDFDKNSKKGAKWQRK